MQGVPSVVSHVKFNFGLKLCMMSLQVPFASLFLVLVITVDCCKNCLS